MHYFLVGHFLIHSFILFSVFKARKNENEAEIAVKRKAVPFRWKDLVDQKQEVGWIDLGNHILIVGVFYLQFIITNAVDFMPVTVAIAFLLITVGSVAFHFWSPWWWTEVASNWGGMDDTIILTFITGFVFVVICLFVSYCVWKFAYNKDKRAEYKPEDKKLESRLTWITTLGVAALLAPHLVVWNSYVTVPEMPTRSRFLHTSDGSIGCLATMEF